jgi:allantoinase
MRWSAAPHVIRSKNVCLPDGVAPASVVVHNGLIQRVGPWDDTAHPSSDVQDVGELFVMPGLVDTHVHINDPGRTEWEGFETATKAAAAGGVTTLMDMPLNSVPATNNPNSLDKKRRAAQGKCHVDVGFLGGVVPNNHGQVQALWDAGVFAFKCFLVPSGVNEFAHVTAADLDKAMPVLAKMDATLMAHCELPELIGSRIEDRGSRQYSVYQASRPPEAETKAVEMLAGLLKKHGARGHVVHVSAMETVDIVRRARAELEIALTAESCPHYLAISGEEIPEGATEFKCAPPIRGKANQDGLWQGFADSVLEMIVSDHSPCPPSAKRKDTGDFFAAWGGIASLELGLSVVVTELRHRGIAPGKLATWMASAPARLVSIDHRKGRIQEGRDADFAIFDPFTPFTVDQATLHQRHKLTPYHGRELVGKVHATYLRGRLIFADGRVVGGPTGQLLSRV